MNNIIEVKNVSFGYNNNLIFKEITFSVGEGNFVAIVGDNGSGKSTLMKLIIKQLEPNKGEINLNYGNKIGYVPQLSASISNDFPITVREILALNLSHEIKRFGKINKQTEKKIDMIINLVGLKEKKDTLFGSLSGGQKQKTMLGKALIANPSLLLLDEPLIGLDKDSKRSFLNLLAHQSLDHNITIIMVTHDLEEIKEYVDKVLKVGEGRVVEI